LGKSRNKSRSEVEALRGQVRQLKAELKYYKRRSHIENTIIDEEPVENVNTTKCPNCHDGVLVEYDWRFVLVKKCTDCDFQVRKKK
jgi:hypothetical protein